MLVHFCRPPDLAPWNLLSFCLDRKDGLSVPSLSIYMQIFSPPQCVWVCKMLCKICARPTDFVWRTGWCAVYTCTVHTAQCTYDTLWVCQTKLLWLGKNEQANEKERNYAVLQNENEQNCFSFRKFHHFLLHFAVFRFLAWASFLADFFSTSYDQSERILNKVFI